jgi:rhodanese-related sulfurtransferase
LYDALRMRFRELKLRRDPECPVCGDNPTIRTLIDYEQFCGLPRAAASAPALPAELEVSVEDLNASLGRDQAPLLIDVREPQEFQICRIPGSTLIPLGVLPQRLDELRATTAGRPIVVHCKSGARSAKAVKLLHEAGIDQARNLKGGILAWIDRVDPTLPKY